MQLICLDFESMFSDTFTLKKLTLEEYIRSPQFEVHGVGLQVLGHSAQWIPQESVAKAFSAIDWANTAVIGHNLYFDSFILSHVYNVHPARHICTMSMAKLMLGNHVSAALGALAKHYGLEEKTVPYDAMKGVRWCNMSPALRRTLAEGCLRDVELTVEVFKRLSAPAYRRGGMLPSGEVEPVLMRDPLRDFPREEYDVIDATIKMFVEPRLIGDTALLDKIAMDEFTSKASAMAALGVTKADLQSSAKFAALLEAEGVEVEYKEGKNGPIPAFAATDEFMKELADDEDRSGALVRARLESKSTLGETRAGRLADMSRRGRLPIYLSYCGAHTTRWSGGAKTNFQNFPRGGDIRRAIKAPLGYVLAVIDFSQIEARVINTLAGQHDIVEAFASGRDLYSEGASRFYGRQITKKENPTERHMGKVLELGCGYGLGWKRLQATCRNGALGGPPIYLTEDEARSGVKTYRETHKQVVAYWRQGDEMLRHIGFGLKGTMAWGPLTISADRITLPNGAPMHYYLTWDSERETWTRRTRSGERKIWGGALVENIVQALSRVIMSQAMLRIKAKFGLDCVWTVHDELVYLLPADGHEGAKLEALMEEMRVRPAWLPDVPLDVEGGIGGNYAAAK